jgi:hypothetical protein
MTVKDTRAGEACIIIIITGPYLCPIIWFMTNWIRLREKRGIAFYRKLRATEQRVIA